MYYTTKHFTTSTKWYRLLLAAQSGKQRLPLDHRYLSALIAQRLACSHRRRKVPGSNPTVGIHFSFCNSWFALLTGLVSPCK